MMTVMMERERERVMTAMMERERERVMEMVRVMITEMVRMTERQQEAPRPLLHHCNYFQPPELDPELDLVHRQRHNKTTAPPKTISRGASF